MPCITSKFKKFFLRVFKLIQMFFYTHHLFVVWWTLLILHAPNFWKWFIGPALIYAVERISSLSIVNKARYGKTFIKEGIIFPSNVSKMECFIRDDGYNLNGKGLFHFCILHFALHKVISQYDVAKSTKYISLVIITCIPKLFQK